MPTDRLSNATDTPTDDTARAETSACVLSDDAMDRSPGGGGLMGATAAETAPHATAQDGGPAPNAPIDTGVTQPDETTSTGTAREQDRSSAATK